MLISSAIRKEKAAQKTANKWDEAIMDTEKRVLRLERESTKLKMAIRLMKRQVLEGVPWPGSMPSTELKV